MNSHQIQIEKWDRAKILLTEAAVRERHTPPEDFRISVFWIDAGTRYSGSTREGVVYVLSGSCSWSLGGRAVAAEEGDILQLPDSTYEFEVRGDDRCQIIHVWNLKEIWTLHNHHSEQIAAGQPAARSESK
jgi:hypothetical protein